VDPDLIDQAISIVEGAPLPAAEFRIYTGLLKAERGIDGKRRLWGVASSTIKDLHGDTMLESALDDMLKFAQNNLTIFLNHSYDVPEDVAGSVETASMSTQGVDENGDPVRTLEFQIVINDVNERAIKSWEAIHGGTKLGLSIGALIPEGGAVRDRKTGALTISRVYLLETSIVSIPANPISWIDRATKALRRAENERNVAIKSSRTMSLGQPTLVLDGPNYTITGSMEGIEMAVEHPGTGAAMEGIEVPADGVMREFVIESTVTRTVEVTEATKCPDCGKDKGSGGDCGNPFHRDVEPDVTDARIRIIEVDTDDGSSGGGSSQEAGSSEGSDSDPGTGDGAAVVETVSRSISGLEPALALSVRGVLALLEATTARLEVTQRELDTERVARQLAEQRRSDTIKEVSAIVLGVHQVIEKLADTPLGRKARFLDAQNDLSHLEGLYGPEFLKVLQSHRG
jgi:hypothetical protein